jgi:hypothetical protein|tara:strand:+ start:425 stop:658 length:234 start_codon:yes stop_codon:yes gene_type:complete
MMGKVIVEVLKGEKNMSESFGQWLNRVFIGKPNKELSEMTKLELEAKGREVGIELDRRLMKHKLVKQLEKKLGRTHA